MEGAPFQAVLHFVDLFTCGVNHDRANFDLTGKPAGGFRNEIVSPLGLTTAKEDPISARIEEQFPAITFGQQMDSKPILRVERIALGNDNGVGFPAIIDDQKAARVSKRNCQHD